MLSWWGTRSMMKHEQVVKVSYNLKCHRGAINLISANSSSLGSLVFCRLLVGNVIAVLTMAFTYFPQPNFAVDSSIRSIEELFFANIVYTINVYMASRWHIVLFCEFSWLVISTFEVRDKGTSIKTFDLVHELCACIVNGTAVPYKSYESEQYVSCLDNLNIVLKVSNTNFIQTNRKTH